MHKLVFVLSEPQWTLSTEALNHQLHYPALCGPARCSQSWLRHISPGVVTSVAEVLVLKCLIEMRWMLSRWNTTVLILLHCNYCSSAPLPCPAQARSRTSLGTPASQSAWSGKPCMMHWHCQAQDQLLAWRSQCPSLSPADEVLPKSWGCRAPCLRSSSLKLRSIY